MNEDLLNKLENISELSVEELSALKDEVISAFKELDSQEDRTEDSVNAMTTLAEAFSNIKGEESRRVEKDKELEVLAQQASEVFNEPETEEDPEEETTVEETESTEEGEEDGAEELAVENTPEEEVEEELFDDELPAEELPEEVAPEEVPVEEEELLPEEEVDEDEVDTEFSNADPEEEEEAEDEAPVEDKSELTNEDSTTESEDNVASVNTEFSAPDENAPVESVQEERQTATIVAAADVRNLTAGSIIPNKSVLAQAMLDRRHAMGRTSGGDGEQALVASIKTDEAYGENRTLDSTDTVGNRAKVETVVAALRSGDDEALVAAGGLYGPVETSYDIYELGETTGRPVRDALPSFKADRGGLRFMTPPVLSDLDGAVSVWTLQDDIDAADPASDKVKPAIRIKAGTEVTVYLEALPMILTFGNIGARAYPELVERHIDLAMVWQARFAESRLLQRIGNLSTQVTAAAELGAARDILVQVDQASAALRSRHRLDPEAPLKAIFPIWFKNALRADLVKQLPGDGQEAAFSLADATITRLFSERNVDVVWSLDGEATQVLGAQANGALNEFPDNVIWYLFPDGTFLFLEDAAIDLGIVRDSTLNATNDYQMFVESFENVAKVGVESLRITSALAIAGASAGTVNTLA